MAYLKWLDDKVLEQAVDHLLEKAKKARLKADKKFGKNVIDPFSAIFEMSGFEIDYETWVKNEKTRQAQKTLQNHVGNFHQSILGSVDGWENMKTGKEIDLLCEDKKIIAEVKNKFSTVSGGKLADLYYSLDDLVMPKASKYKNYTAYYVSIIPKRPKRFNKEFTPSDKAKGDSCPANPKVREIDGASFYSLVSGEDNALESLFDILPSVIENVSKGDYKIPDKNKLKEFFSTAFE